MAEVSLDRFQYRIRTEPRPGAISVGRHWIEVGEGLPVTSVVDAAGRAVGSLLGFPIDIAERRTITGRWELPAIYDADPERFALAAMEALGGLFLWIFDTGAGCRIYADSSAQVPCVYDPVMQVAASSAHALFDDETYASRFDQDLFDRLGVDGEGWFPGGLTAHHGLSRLLCNHYLDLEDWQVRRFWPAQPITPSSDPDAIIEELIEIIQAQIAALVAAPEPLAMALTAGHETRMLLACAREWLDDIDFVTVTAGDRHKTDTMIARRIARDLGLRHRELPRLEASAEERDLFIRRGGHCNADSNAIYHPSVWSLAKTHVFSGGLGGEVGRAFLWRATDTPQTDITSSLLTGRFGLPPTPEVTKALDTWLDEARGYNAFQTLDLAYMEHRNAAWYAVQFCADPTLVRHAPLLTYRSCALMLSLPPEWKRESRMSHSIIEALWPELNKYPYNSLGAWSDALVKVQRMLSDPRVILKRLRKMRAG